MKEAAIRIRCLALFIVFILLWIWISADGRMHWDEPGYLYSGIYQTRHQILAGDVQATGEADFTVGRILHILAIRAVMAIVGNERSTCYAVTILYTLLLFGSLYLIFKMLRLLLPQTGECFHATLLLAVSSIVMYMAFKTLPDTAALSATVAATYGLLRANQGGTIFWCAIAAIGLSLAALVKAQAAFIIAGFWAAGSLVPVAGLNRCRLFFQGGAAGVGGIVLTIGFLHCSGVGSHRFVDSYMAALESGLPFAAKLFNVATEFSVLWIIVALSFLSHRRRELSFMWLWFIVSTAPFLLLITNIEARHLSANLVAVGGLFALALEAVNRRFSTWQQWIGRHKRSVHMIGIALLMGCNYLTLFIMPHEVQTGQMTEMLAALDERYGPGNYSILTPWGYTNFHVLRVLWPQIDAGNLDISSIAVNTDISKRRQSLDAYHHSKCYGNIDELPLNGKPLVYLSYAHTFGAENLNAALRFISPKLARWVMGDLSLVDHLYNAGSEWLWGNPSIELVPIDHVGHYLAFEITHARVKNSIINSGIKPDDTAKPEAGRNN